MRLPHGILAMLVTPFDGEYQLNEAALRREVQWCLDHDAAELLRRRLPALQEML